MPLDKLQRTSTSLVEPVMHRKRRRSCPDSHPPALHHHFHSCALTQFTGAFRFFWFFLLHHFGVSIWIQSEQEQKWNDCLTVNLPSCVRNTPQIHRRFRLLIKDSRCPPLSGINYRQQKLIFEKKCFLPTLNHCSPLLPSP